MVCIVRPHFQPGSKVLVSLAGTITKSPLRYLPYFPMAYKPPKTAKIGLAAAAVAVAAIAFYSQGQLAAQLANFSI